MLPSQYAKGCSHGLVATCFFLFLSFLQSGLHLLVTSIAQHPWFFLVSHSVNAIAFFRLALKGLNTYVSVADEGALLSRKMMDAFDFSLMWGRIPACSHNMDSGDSPREM